MSTGDVYTSHVDGGLGLTQFDRWRIHAKIGVAEAGDLNTPKLLINERQARDTLLSGPLLDRGIEHFESFWPDRGESAQPFFAVRANADTAGSVDYTKNGTGDVAAPTITGTPTANRKVVLRITKAGAHGTAEYRRSTDGGLTYAAAQVTPATGQPINLDLGVTAAFADAGTPADTFDVGDLLNFDLVGPTASDAAIVTAAEALKMLPSGQAYHYNFIHVGAPASVALAISLSTLADQMAADNKHPTFFVLEARGKANGESTADYLTALVDEWSVFHHPRIMIVSAEGRYIAGGIPAAGGPEAVALQLASGSLQSEWRNAATFVCARMAAGNVNESPAHVAKNASRALYEIRYWQDGGEDYAEVLNDSGHTVLKRYENYPGIYIARARMHAPPNSDFQEAPERRRVDKAHRILREHALPFIEADSDAVSLDYFAGAVSAAVATQMAGELNSFRIVVDPDNSFQATGVLIVDAIMTIGKRYREIRFRTSYAPAT